MTFSPMTLFIMQFNNNQHNYTQVDCIKTNGTQYVDIQHKETQNNDIQHNDIQNSDILHIDNRINGSQH